LYESNQDKNPEPKLQHQVKRDQNETNLSLSFTNVFVRVRLSKHQKEFISFFYLSEDKEKEREILESLLYASSSTPPRDIFLFFPRLSFALGRGVVKLFFVRFVFPGWGRTPG
jgi:hypothetical protein